MHWKRSRSWERSKAKGEGNGGGWDARWHHWLNGYEFEQNSERYWRTEEPCMLQSMGSQRVGHKSVTKNNNNNRLILLGSNGHWWCPSVWWTIRHTRQLRRWFYAATTTRTMFIKRECFKKRKAAWDFIKAGKQGSCPWVLWESWERWRWSSLNCREGVEGNMRDARPFEVSYFSESWRGLLALWEHRAQIKFNIVPLFVQEEQASSLRNQMIILNLLSEVKQDLRVSQMTSRCYCKSSWAVQKWWQRSVVLESWRSDSLKKWTPDTHKREMLM